jgi:hypothetical protein
MNNRISLKCCLVSMVFIIFTFNSGLFAQYTSLTASPAELACFTLDPTTGIIYAQDDGNTGGGTAWFSYNPNTNAWTALAACPLNSGNNGGGDYVNGKIYTIYTGNSTQMGVYTIASDSWTTITNGLGLGTGCMTTDGNYIYAVRSTTFRRYDPATNIWTNLANPSISFQAWGGLAYYNGWLYGHSGNGSTGFAKYEIASNTWTTLTSVPGGAVLGSDIDPVGKVYYCTGSYGGNTMYKYDLVAATWSTESLPWTPTDDGGMAYSCLASYQGMYVSQGQAGTAFAKRATPAGCGCIVADPGGPYTVYQGSGVTLDASASTGVSTYAWDMDNDSAYDDQTGVNPTISWATLNTYGINNINSYPIGLMIDDGTGCTVVNSTVLNVINPAPTVTTQAVSAIAAASATGNGNITNLGVSNPTAHGVCWNTSGSPATSDNVTNEGGASSTGAFTSAMAGLSPNTTYYVRAYAINSAGTSYGSQVNFTTLDAPAPVVATNAASAISSSGATLNGTVNASGFQTTVTFEYGETVSYGNTVTASQSPVTGSTATAVSAVLTGLSPNQTYHYRVVGQNIAATAYGGDMTFTTGALPPTVITAPVSSIQATLADCGGEVTASGGLAVTARGVCWHTSFAPTLSNSHTVDGSGLGSFTSYLTGLTPETIYYVRAYATNNIGTAYGDTISFITLVMPTITITNPQNGATVNGVVSITAATSSTAIMANFYIDNQLLGSSTKSGSVFLLNWDTGSHAEGTHTIKVTAQDRYGQALLDQVEVTILNLKISLNVVRKEDRAFTFKVFYGEVVFTVFNPRNISVSKYVVYRSENSGAFTSIAELTSPNHADGSFIHYDKTMNRNTAYSYKIIAYDSGGNVLSVSEVKTI